jgi:hypothetical protein
VCVVCGGRGGRFPVGEASDSGLPLTTLVACRYCRLRAPPRVASLTWLRALCRCDTIAHHTTRTPALRMRPLPWRHMGAAWVAVSCGHVADYDDDTSLWIVSHRIVCIQL